MPGFLLPDLLKLTTKQYDNMIYGELIHAAESVRNGEYNMEMYQQLLPQAKVSPIVIFILFISMTIKPF